MKSRPENSPDAPDDSMPSGSPGAANRPGGHAKENATLQTLNAADWQMFAKLHIPDSLLADARIERVSDAEAREKYGVRWSKTGRLEGLIFPYYAPENGYRSTARLRRDNPEVDAEGKPQGKYLCPYGDRRRLYYPPGAAGKLADKSIPLVLVEAEKSSLALTAWASRIGRNLLAVAVGGCWGWKGRVGTALNENGERVQIKDALFDFHYFEGREVVVLLDANAAENPAVQAAERALVSKLKQWKAAKVRVCRLPKCDGVNGPDDLLAVAGDEAMARVLDGPMSNGEDRLRDLSDDALALAFTGRHRENFRYTAEWSRWSEWDGQVWREDRTLRVFDLARTLCRDVRASSPRGGNRTTSAGTVAAVERLARSDRHHAAVVSQWDADNWLLGTPGGAVDLRTGNLRPPRREDYITKVTAVAPSGDCPQWKAFLQRVLAKDEALQSYAQRLCGYALTGDTSEEIFAFVFGPGANGKSKFVNTFAHVLGDYAQTAPMETFVVSAVEPHPTNLAALRGARLVTSVETENGRRWSEAKIKALTGGDRIAARYMRQDYFQYTPQLKLIIAGNHKPRLRSVDEDMRRRLHLVPFTVIIPREERDLKLGEKLLAEASGILQWAVEGCLAWQREGLKPPPAVLAATQEYFRAEDAIAHWMEDCVVLVKSSFNATTALYANYRRWAEAAGEFVESRHQFREKLMRQPEVKLEHTRTARGFWGLRLKEEA